MNDGEGARRAGGRWNHKGTAMMYCGAAASLCALEVLAHSAMLPTGMFVVQARIPNSVPIQTVEESDLLRIGAGQGLPRKHRTSERIG